MKVVITGASGLIGTALTTSLRADGHDVVRLVRREPAAADEAHWDPAHRTVDVAAITGADAVVHLAGAGVGDKRWSPDYQRTILDSRVDGTTTIADAVARTDDKPSVLVAASAVGYYGERGEEILDEGSSKGRGFLSDVVEKWEASTAAASDAGVRVVHLRTGLVMSPEGGLLAKILPIFKAGLGGKLGSGRQWMPWVALRDEVAAIRFLIDHDECSGAFDLCAPNPVRNSEFTKSLGKALHRPAIAMVPRLALKAALGGFADEGALVSQRVMPARLSAAGFEFAYDDLDAALRAML